MKTVNYSDHESLFFSHIGLCLFGVFQNRILLQSMYKRHQFLDAILLQSMYKRHQFLDAILLQYMYKRHQFLDAILLQSMYSSAPDKQRICVYYAI